MILIDKLVGEVEQPPLLVAKYFFLLFILSLYIMFATTLKTLAFFTYACLIVFTPEMPSYYTFSINTLGFIVTGFATNVLLHYLNTRPAQQKTLLNRLLVLLVSLSFLTTIRSYLLSVAACWFNALLKEFVEAYPHLCISCMPLKHYSLAVSSGFFSFSAGRLLLFSSPATFNNINPSLWAMIAGFTCISVSVIDSTSHRISCSIIPKDNFGSIMYILKGELGILNLTRFNKSLVEVDWKDKAEEPCSYFPTLLVVLLLALVLEGIKICTAVYRKVVQVHRQATVFPVTAAKMTMKMPRKKTKLHRSESFPTISKPNVENRRRQSLQLPKHPAKTTRSNKIQFLKTTGKQVASIRKKHRIDLELRKLMSLLCMRSVTFITVFVIISTLILSMIFIMHIQERSSSIVLQANSVIGRISVYVINCALVIYDKDILEHIMIMFN